jgi:hypothetical protein
MIIPQARLPASNWEHIGLYQQIGTLLTELPNRFQSAITVNGILATEIYAFSNVLGLTIEQEVIRTLNALRSLWDTEGEYQAYRFFRQAQTFPDVLLMNAETRHIIMGLELKSWYVLAKEGEPSFRYQVTPDPCAIQDLLVIVPWALSNVLSGSPIVFSPFIAPARYVAEYRNYWWQHLRKTIDRSEILSPNSVTPYPAARSKMSDKPVYDDGKNFGRIAL